MRGQDRGFLLRETRLRSRLGSFSLLLALLATAACSVGGDSGIDPPMNRVFLPTGAVVDGTGTWLLVVNSNSDLRYSFGTVVPLDLRKAREDRLETWPLCPSTRYRPGPNDGRLCCRDLLDNRILNCDDRPYAAADATVRVGSFATAPVVQTYARGGQRVERLFFGVRADPSVTFVDATVSPQGISLRCTGDPLQTTAPEGRNPRCDANWRVQEGTLEGTEVLLPEEPFALNLDPALGVLYVGHLFGGLSAIDVCGPGTAAPRLGSLVPNVYARQSAGVTSIVSPARGVPSAPVWTTARSGLLLGQLYFRDAAQLAACTPARDITLVPGTPIAASTFDPRGAETRGLVYQPDRRRVFVLHRNSSGNPAALARMTVETTAAGEVELKPAEAIDVCSGPSELLAHNAGRGQRLYIPCFESGQIYMVDPELMVVVEAIEAGRGPSAITFDPTDATKAYVIGYVDNNVSILDLRPGSPTENRVIQRLGFPRTSTQL